MHPAVFLDRDGTINEQMGYVNHVSRFRMFPTSPPAIRRLNRAGFKVVVVTNQSGAARGYFPPALLEEVHLVMREMLAEMGAHLDGLYMCTHAPDAGCDCRKPKPGLVLQAARELDLDLSRSYVVGDRWLDLELAANAGTSGILVLTGYGLGELENYQGPRLVQPVKIAEHLGEAADWIIQQQRGPSDFRK